MATTAKKTAAKKTTATKATTKATKTVKGDDRSTATGWTEEEREAMKEHSRELKRGKADGTADLLAKIAEMPDGDRQLAERLHSVITAAGPDLELRTWYGMPAYAKDGKVLCFFQNSAKFKARYATLGFSDEARLDDGALWPVSYAVTEMTDAVEKKVTELVKAAIG